MSTAKDPATEKGVSIDELAERLGPGAGEELFYRLDEDLREGDIVLGINVRDARNSFRSVRRSKAQFVVPNFGRKKSASDINLSEGVIIIQMQDLEAVVDAGRSKFNWAEKFAPEKGLAAADELPALIEGSRGARSFEF